MNICWYDGATCWSDAELQQQQTNTVSLLQTAPPANTNILKQLNILLYISLLRNLLFILV